MTHRTPNLFHVSLWHESHEGAQLIGERDGVRDVASAVVELLTEADDTVATADREIMVIAWINQPESTVVLDPTLISALTRARASMRFVAHLVAEELWSTMLPIDAARVVLDEHPFETIDVLHGDGEMISRVVTNGRDVGAELAAAVIELRSAREVASTELTMRLHCRARGAEFYVSEDTLAALSVASARVRVRLSTLGPTIVEDGERLRRAVLLPHVCEELAVELEDGDYDVVDGSRGGVLVTEGELLATCPHCGNSLLPGAEGFVSGFSPCIPEHMATSPEQQHA